MKKRLLLLALCFFLALTLSACIGSSDEAANPESFIGPQPLVTASFYGTL